VKSDFRPEVEILPSRLCAMHPAIIIGTVRSLWTWLWGRYHVPQNVFLVFFLLSFYECVCVCVLCVCVWAMGYGLILEIKVHSFVHLML